MAVHERTQNLVDVIISDHRGAEKVFTELERGTMAPEHRKELVNHVITKLVRHSVAEEQHMYSAARRLLDDGDQVADEETQEHAQAERVMKELEGLDATDPRYDELVRTLVSEIRHHVTEEEDDLLPRLQQVCSREEPPDPGKKVLDAKRTAPTRTLLTSRRRIACSTRGRE